MQGHPTTDDHYRRALGHLDAAMEAVSACDDTLALAVIAQAVGIVERAIAIRTAD